MKEQWLDWKIVLTFPIWFCRNDVPDTTTPTQCSQIFVNKRCENTNLFWYFKKIINNSSKAWSKAHKIVILKSIFLCSAMICWTQYLNVFFSDNATENYQMGLRFNNSWRSTFCKWNIFAKLLPCFSFAYGAKNQNWSTDTSSRFEETVFQFVKTSSTSTNSISIDRIILWGFCCLLWKNELKSVSFETTTALNFKNFLENSC